MFLVINIFHKNISRLERYLIIIFKNVKKLFCTPVCLKFVIKIIETVFAKFRKPSTEIKHFEKTTLPNNG